jgi:hypothetical protein
VTNILFILAAIFFALDAFRVPAPFNWTPAGFCMLTLALWVM